MNEETITITEYGFRHIGDWTLLPWLATADNGWEITWLFLIISRFTLTAEEFEFYDGDDDDFSGHTQH